LDDYLYRIEEAKKRDHRKLGAELDLFSLHDEGPGFPFFHPKGMVLWHILEDFWREEHQQAGYQEVRTPPILNRTLWEQSGHWDHYRENMYFTKIDDLDYAVKPMNCPGGLLVYKSRLHSYRELPIRLAELGLVHRHELSGTLHGLMRVRCFTQDDAHIFMLRSQVTEEIIGVINMIDKFYQIFGFEYYVELSTKPADAMGSDEIWEMATTALQEALEAKGYAYKINEGDGAFYGPKIDFHLRDCLGRTWQCGTIQLDFVMPEQLDLTYIGEDAQKHRPVMIHRVIFGSLERFIGILIEHYAGAFPLWLAPVQVKELTVTDRSKAYAQKILQALAAHKIRAELDERNEKIGYKIREAQMEKVPYMLVIGDREIDEGTVAVRKRQEGDIGARKLDEFIDNVQREATEKKFN
jgi:threonyl-tRNA synthetase